MSNVPYSLMWKLSGLCAVLAAVLYFYRARLSPKATPKEEWRTDANFLPSLVARAEPVVLVHTPFDAWPSRKWTPEYLSSKLQFVMTKQSSQNVFKYFADGQPLSNVSDVIKSYSEVILTGEQFIEKVFHSPDKNFYYASGPVDMLGVQQDVGNPSSMTVFTGKMKSTATVNFWIGSAGVTAHTHYDTSHNFHAVMFGRKRFLLFPPETHTALKLYPCIHPFYRQVQIDVFSSEVARNTAIEVELLPGDTLYIPPYWFHAVVTVDPTISLNVWSASGEHGAMEEAYGLALPFDETWPVWQFYLASKLYVDRVLFHLESRFQMSSEEFLRELYQERYEWLLEGINPVETGVGLTADETAFIKAKSREFSSKAQHLVDVVTAGHVGRRPHVLKVNIGNWVEHMAFRCVSKVSKQRKDDVKELLKSFYQTTLSPN